MPRGCSPGTKIKRWGRAEGLASLTGDESRPALGVRDGGVAPELLGHTGSFVVDLLTREVGQKDRRNVGGEGLLRTELTCSGGSGEIPTRVRPEVGNGGSSMIRGPKAELCSGL